ncbi:SF1B family DNA helicase RecD2 [Faecalibaculum rodentium]|uniref:SF1B family DNA helicase RecD2 n=1 Tax=Faecalibaculum rodentium TaxID=1702221 RepID=UPI0025A1146F|nr:MULTISPECIES: ATP-dependent RecD-like DNA helicase [Bacteria]
MRCRFVKEIFHNKDNGFCIFVYHTEDGSVPEAARDARYKGEGFRFTATGTGLPETDKTEADFQGKWIKSRYGLQLQVESYEEMLPQTEEGIKGYLSSGMIKGIGPRTAELIVEKFGTRTFDVLDHYPDSLLEIKGITRKKLDAILLSYQGSHALRDLAAYLTPFKVTPKKIQKIYEEFGNDALDTVKNQPFSLCRINGFGFLTVDEIAKANKGKPDDPMRIEGCVRYCMEQEMQEGHLYQDKQQFQKKVYEQLNAGYGREAVTEVDVYKVLYRLVKEKQMYYDSGALYPANMYGYECGAAKKLASLLLAKQEAQADITFLLAEAQRELGIGLSPKQEESVRQAFSHLVSIVTGGPGTGKTTVQKVLLYINEKLGGSSVLLTAPTGRASRRMAESTGWQDAMTMHSALGLTSDEDNEEMEGMLEAGFIIVDEFTMSDMRLSYIFFDHIRAGTRLVLVGDVDQLPSVGPGNVFRELVQCGVIPVTVLDMVFRQAEDSRIAANAKRMQENDAALDYGAGFTFIPAGSAAEAAEKTQELYRASVDAFGEDKVQVLTPYRKKGDASVDALNERLWEMVNPKAEGKPEIRSGKRTFRLGDRIIHNKNKNQISNGDIGCIKNIYVDDEGTELAELEFSDGRRVEYNSDELEMVEHAYATTVHKSQGSEYPMVILPWLPMFYKMLRRNIFYTAVTRAKAQVAIIGSKKAICTAIHNTECDRRNTRLGERVIREYNRLLEEKKDQEKDAGYRQEVMNL